MAASPPTLLDLHTLLPRRHWWPPNHAALLAFATFIRDNAAGAVCTFDWDNTCVYHDIGDLAFAWQLGAARITHSPASLRALWMPILTTFEAQSHASPARDEMAATRAWLLQAMNAWEEVEQTKDDVIGREDTASAPLSARHQFRASLFAAMRNLVAHGSDRVIAETFCAVARMWPSDGGALLERDLDALLAFNAMRTGDERWQCPATDRAPAIDVPIPSPVTVIEEMRDFVATLTSVGAHVAIVTASPEPLVRALSQRLRFQVAPESVIGMPTGPIEVQRPHAARTYRAGKVEGIAQRLPAPPLFAAGDALTDYEMLTSFSEMRLRLLIERPPLPEVLQALADDAHQSERPPSFAERKTTTLLQARDARRVGFCADRPVSLGG